MVAEQQSAHPKGYLLLRLLGGGGTQASLLLQGSQSPSEGKPPDLSTLAAHSKAIQAINPRLPLWPNPLPDQQGSQPIPPLHGS